MFSIPWLATIVPGVMRAAPLSLTVDIKLWKIYTLSNISCIRNVRKGRSQGTFRRDRLVHHKGFTIITKKHIRRSSRSRKAINRDEEFVRSLCIRIEIGRRSMYASAGYFGLTVVVKAKKYVIHRRYPHFVSRHKTAMLMINFVYSDNLSITQKCILKGRIYGIRWWSTSLCFAIDKAHPEANTDAFLFVLWVRLKAVANAGTW